MKIVFVSGTMLGGGAERVVSILANSFIKQGFSVSIIVVRGNSVYELNESILVSPLYQEHEIGTGIFNKILRRFNFHKRLFDNIKAEKADILIPVHGGGWNATIILIAKIL